jgi:hypothetical protein
MALKMSESEIGDKDRDPKDDNAREGKTLGEGLLINNNNNNNNNNNMSNVLFFRTDCIKLLVLWYFGQHVNYRPSQTLKLLRLICFIINNSSSLTCSKCLCVASIRPKAEHASVVDFILCLKLRTLAIPDDGTLVLYFLVVFYGRKISRPITDTVKSSCIR